MMSTAVLLTNHVLKYLHFVRDESSLGRSWMIDFVD